MDWPDGTVTDGNGTIGPRPTSSSASDYNTVSVLKVGPASGFLTKEMARRGAHVTCIDLPDDEPWQSVPRADVAVEEFDQQRKRGTHLLRRSWWLTQKRWETGAGMAYMVPTGCGRWAITTGRWLRPRVAAYAGADRVPLQPGFAGRRDRGDGALVKRVEGRGGAIFLPGAR